jgi:hypothetical protein
VSKKAVGFKEQLEKREKEEKGKNQSESWNGSKKPVGFTGFSGILVT